LRAIAGADASYIWPWHRTAFCGYDQRMKILSILIILLTLATLVGCVVRTGPAYRTRQTRSCPPAHHWDGYGCVHNGHGKHKGHW
jgi:hypothetical protein